MRASLPILLLLLGGCGQYQNTDALGARQMSAKTAASLDRLVACASGKLDPAAVKAATGPQQRTVLNAGLAACPDDLAAAQAGYAADFLVFEPEAAVSIRKLARSRLTALPHFKS